MGVSADAAARKVGVCQKTSWTVERVAVAVFACREQYLDVRHTGGLRERERRYLAPHLQVATKNRPSGWHSSKNVPNISVKRHVWSAVTYLTKSLLQFYRWMQPWTNLENRSAFNKVTCKSIMTSSLLIVTNSPIFMPLHIAQTVYPLTNNNIVHI